MKFFRKLAEMHLPANADSGAITISSRKVSLGSAFMCSSTYASREMGVKPIFSIDFYPTSCSSRVGKPYAVVVKHGKTIPEVCKEIEVSEQTCYRRPDAAQRNAGKQVAVEPGLIQLVVCRPGRTGKNTQRQ